MTTDARAGGDGLSSPEAPDADDRVRPSVDGGPHPDDRVWYAAYGSNLASARFRCYVQGGRPDGGRRVYPGCRDTSWPARVEPYVASGTVHFAGESSVWGGGMAFYDPSCPGTALMSAYLVTREQLLDVLTQEMRRDPRTCGPLTIAARLEAEPVVPLGPGRYESVHLLGAIDGMPVLTLSHGLAEAALPPNAPTTAYLRWVVLGLHEAHGLDAKGIADYLADCPGVGQDAANLRILADRTLTQAHDAAGAAPDRLGHEDDALR